MRVSLRTRDSYVADTLTEQQQVVLLARSGMRPAIPHTLISGRLRLVRLAARPSPPPLWFSCICYPSNLEVTSHPDI